MSTTTSTSTNRPDHDSGLQGRARYKKYVFERAATNWERYIEELRDVGRLVEVQGVAIDGESLFRRRFTCDPRICAPGKKPGGEKWRQSGEKSCCAELTVDLTVEEQRALRANWEPVRAFLQTKDRFFKDKPYEDMVELGVDYEVQLKKRGKRCICLLYTSDAADE